MVYKFFDKEKTSSSVSVNEELPEELHKPIMEKFQKKNVYARFKDIIWAADLAEIRSLSSKNQNVKYLIAKRFIETLKAKISIKKNDN